MTFGWHLFCLWIVSASVDHAVKCPMECFVTEGHFCGLSDCSVHSGCEDVICSEAFECCELSIMSFVKVGLSDQSALRWVR